MTTTGTPATAMDTTCVIRLADFDGQTYRTSSGQPPRWTRGILRHVVAALADEPVAIVADDRTGHTLLGVHLLGVLGTGSDSRVTYRWYTSDGRATVSSVYLFDLGTTIVPLTQAGSGAKWTALDTHRREVSAAIAVAQRERGESQGRAWGAWTGRATSNGVYVEYTPHTGNTAYADRWGTAWRGEVVGESIRNESADGQPVTVEQLRRRELAAAQAALDAATKARDLAAARLAGDGDDGLPAWMAGEDTGDEMD